MYRQLSIVFVLFFYSSILCGQAITNEASVQRLNENKRRADEFSSKNLYRFGLDQLQQYDRSFDLIYAQENKDTLNTLDKTFEISNAKMQSDFTALQKTKEAFETNQAGFNNSYGALVTKATLVVVLLLSAFIFILVLRRRKLNLLKAEIFLYRSKVEKAKNLAVAGEQLIEQSKKNLAVYSSLGGNLKETNPDGGKIMQLSIPDNSQWKEVMMHAKKINQLVQSETLKNAAIVELVNNDQQEKTSSDINQLCSHYFELVKDGFQLPDGQAQIKVTTDLEKNLPQVKVIPAAIGHLLIHVLSNAMQSVQARAMKKVKGYEPKVSLSTRVLPRFVQIRINDNGEGIEDQYIDKIKEAFFTLKTDYEAGLGLYISNLILKNHQGEIKIESDKARGTDVYLKFFIN